MLDAAVELLKNVLADGSESEMREVRIAIKVHRVIVPLVTDALGGHSAGGGVQSFPRRCWYNLCSEWR